MYQKLLLRLRKARIFGVCLSISQDTVTVMTEQLHRWANYADFRDSIAQAFGVESGAVAGGFMKAATATSPNQPQKASGKRPNYYQCRIQKGEFNERRRRAEARG